MKATHLMKGDWVTFQNAPEIPAKIWGIIGDDTAFAFIFTDNGNALEEISLDKIIGIPLTPEILVKNGFYLSQRDNYHAFLRKGTFEIELKKSTSIEKVLGVKHIGNFGYARKSYNLPLPTFVHELQHALKLCGIDKEITL